MTTQESSQDTGTGAGPPSASSSDTGSSLLGFLFVAIIGAAIVWFSSEETRTFVLTNWPWFVGGGGALVGGGLLIFSVKTLRDWAKNAATPSQLAVLIFFGVPPLLITVMALNFLSSETQTFLLRGGLFVIACLFPSSLYYLFIVTRKASLLNEYIANMARLGLLADRAADPSSDAGMTYRRRTEAYLQKFEAAYGPIHGEVRRELGLAPPPGSGSG